AHAGYGRLAAAVLRRRPVVDLFPQYLQLLPNCARRSERPEAPQPDSCTAADTSLVYSITSSARASSVDGISRPRAFAVVMFMTRSNLVGCSTGRSAGFAPRRILSTKSAARRNKSGKFAP